MTQIISYPIQSSIKYPGYLLNNQKYHIMEILHSGYINVASMAIPTPPQKRDTMLSDVWMALAKDITFTTGNKNMTSFQVMFLCFYISLFIYIYVSISLYLQPLCLYISILLCFCASMFLHFHVPLFLHFYASLPLCFYFLCFYENFGINTFKLTLGSVQK